MTFYKKSSMPKTTGINGVNYSQFSMKSYTDHLKTAYSASKLDYNSKNPFRNNYITTTANVSRVNPTKAPTPPIKSAQIS